MPADLAGSERSFSASSSVIAAIDMLGIEERLGFSPSRAGRRSEAAVARASHRIPVAGSSPRRRAPSWPTEARRFAVALGGRHAEGARCSAFRIVRAADEGPVRESLRRAARRRSAGRRGRRRRPPSLGTDAAPEVRRACSTWRCAAPSCRRSRRERNSSTEAAHHLFPLDLVVRDPVQLVLEVRGEVELHVAREEALEERRHETTLSSATRRFFSSLTYSRSRRTCTVAS